MTITYSLSPIPRWVLMKKNGTAAGGATMETKSNLNIGQDKDVFMDPRGEQAWTNPIVFDADGTAGPFYWQSNDADPTDTYFLIVKDSDGTDLFTIPNYFPPQGAGGGGGGGTTTFNLVNFIANNQFIDHIDDTATPIGSANLVIAPANHSGYTPAFVTPIVGTWGGVGPDTRFVTNTGIATPAIDSITFPEFALNDPALAPDVTPVDYIRYQCGNESKGELYKAFQFPISQKVKNLSNQSMTVKVWAKAASATTIKLFVRQFFGSAAPGNGGSAEVHDEVASWNLTTSWFKQTALITIPNVNTKSLGTAGQQTNDDALYLQLDMPLNAICDVSFTKPALYLGNINPVTAYETYDQIHAITSCPRTGDIRISMTNAPPLGFIAMDDTTIGTVGSGATYASVDMFQLYATLYTCVSDTWAPVSTGRTAPGTTTANAVTDFIAGKTLTMTKTLGRALAEAGAGSGLTARALGEAIGEEDQTLTKFNLPNTLATGVGVTNVTPSGATSVLRDNITGSGTILQTAGVTPVSIMQPSAFMSVFIKT